jgi:hypothetical protein
MADNPPDLLTALLPFAGGAIGAVSGAYFKSWFDSKQELHRLRVLQQQNRWLPLLGAAGKLKVRLEELSGIYRKTMPSMPFSPDSLSADFRELYSLSREERDLENSDPNILRANASTVQVVRTRMAHYLTYAASSLYLMATYLGCAERVSRALKDRSLLLSDTLRVDFIGSLAAVRDALQGPTGAGIPWEEQESVAEMIWSANDSVISYFEFRKRLLELPGWEQYMGLYRFFVSIGPKIEHEVAATIEALSQLEARLDSAAH